MRNLEPLSAVESRKGQESRKSRKGQAFYAFPSGSVVQEFNARSDRARCPVGRSKPPDSRLPDPFLPGRQFVCSLLLTSKRLTSVFPARRNKSLCEKPGYRNSPVSDGNWAVTVIQIAGVIDSKGCMNRRE